jgi:hypothetical protein
MFYKPASGSFLRFQNVFKLSIPKPKDDAHIKFMVRAGVGLFISFTKIAVIQLYHMETFDHLQDINVASSVARSISGMFFHWNTSISRPPGEFMRSHCAVSTACFVTAGAIDLKLCT